MLLDCRLHSVLGIYFTGRSTFCRHLLHRRQHVLPKGRICHHVAWWGVPVGRGQTFHTCQDCAPQTLAVVHAMRRATAREMRNIMQQEPSLRPSCCLVEADGAHLQTTTLQVPFQLPLV